MVISLRVLRSSVSVCAGRARRHAQEPEAEDLSSGRFTVHQTNDGILSFASPLIRKHLFIPVGGAVIQPREHRSVRVDGTGHGIVFGGREQVGTGRDRRRGRGSGV